MPPKFQGMGVLKTRISSALIWLLNVLRLSPKEASAARIWLPRVGGERGRQGRVLDLPDHPIIKAGRRQLLAETGKILGQIALNELGEVLGSLSVDDDRFGRTSASSCSMICSVSVSCA